MQGSHGSGRAPGAATLLGGLQVPDQASPALAAAEVKYLRLQARASETPLLGCTPGTVSAADLCIKHTTHFMQWTPEGHRVLKLQSAVDFHEHAGEQ